jgi:hypothetical protein
MFREYFDVPVWQLSPGLGKISQAGEFVLEEPCFIDKDLVGTGNTRKPGTLIGINIFDNRPEERVLVQNNTSAGTEVRVEQ